MFILSDQIIILIILFPADTFSRKQLIFRPHYKHDKYKLLEKRSCVSVWVCFAPTMPNVSSRFSKFGLKKQTNNNNNCIWFWKKKKKMLRCGGGGGGWRWGPSDFSMVSMCLPFWKPARLDWNWGIIHECSRTCRNNAILSFDYYLSVRAVYYGNPFNFYPFNTNDHRYPYLNSIYKWKYLDSM